MSLPTFVAEGLEAEIGSVLRVDALGGGCVNPAARVETAVGPVFVKYNPDAPRRMFTVEAVGLEHLRTTAAGLRIPRVIASSVGDGHGGWLALEWLEPGPAGAAFAERLGRGLAELHRAKQIGWGWEDEGYIGSLPQPNSPTPTWVDFWWSRRLEPQLELAIRLGRRPGTRHDWDLLAARLQNLLAVAEEEGVSLLHGDLWSGNVISLPDGAAAIVDPAAYRGHREVDLAMTELFGGFGPRFYAAYREIWPLSAGYDDRKLVYQLYYLLVHVNLFGGGYGIQTATVLRRALAGG
jgi:fructosamine-3-kinase